MPDDFAVATIPKEICSAAGEWSIVHESPEAGKPLTMDRVAFFVMLEAEDGRTSLAARTGAGIVDISDGTRLVFGEDAGPDGRSWAEVFASLR